MSVITQDLMLKLMVSIFLLLLGANGWWVKQFISEMRSFRKEFSDAQQVSAAQNQGFKDCRERCDNHTTTVNVRLNEHSKTLKVHGEDIREIKTKLKIKSHDEG
jgi:uncharacterized protein (UPF0335 family)